MTQMRLRDICAYIARTGYIRTPLPGDYDHDSRPEDPREFLWHSDQACLSKAATIVKEATQRIQDITLVHAILPRQSPGISGQFASGAQLPKDSLVYPKSGKSHPEGYALLGRVVNLKHAGQTCQVGWPTKPV
ncbi:hypothetical protein N7527_006981 [Penicillium freii]|nr:hypothetical protein N7527_006981 [Penicillium freii]